jgi:hypothetical protein
VRGILGIKREEETGEWRTVQKEELNELYFSSILLLLE